MLFPITPSLPGPDQLHVWRSQSGKDWRQSRAAQKSWRVLRLSSIAAGRQFERLVETYARSVLWEFWRYWMDAQLLWCKTVLDWWMGHFTRLGGMLAARTCPAVQRPIPHRSLSCCVQILRRWRFLISPTLSFLGLRSSQQFLSRWRRIKPWPRSSGYSHRSWRFWEVWTKASTTGLRVYGCWKRRRAVYALTKPESYKLGGICPQCPLVWKTVGGYGKFSSLSMKNR